MTRAGEEFFFQKERVFRENCWVVLPANTLPVALLGVLVGVVGVVGDARAFLRRRA